MLKRVVRRVMATRLTYFVAISSVFDFKRLCIYNLEQECIIWKLMKS